MKHYFTNEVQIGENEKRLTYNCADRILEFYTNDNLFAKDKIDYPSIILSHSITKKKYRRILDYGCGYGFIGIYLSTVLDYDNITFIDISNVAYTYSQKNIIHNKINNTNILHQDCIDDNMYDLIVLNPPIHVGKDHIFKMYDDACAHLTQNGKFYIVIQKHHGAASSQKYLENIFNIVDIAFKKKGIIVFKCSNE